MTDAPRHALGDLPDPDGFDRLTATMHALTHWYGPPPVDDTTAGIGTDAADAGVDDGIDSGLDAGDLVAFGTGWRPGTIGFEGPDAPTAEELADRIAGEIVDGFTPRIGTDGYPAGATGSEPDLDAALLPIEEPEDHDRDLAAAFDRTFGDGDSELDDGADDGFDDGSDEPGDLDAF